MFLLGNCDWQKCRDHLQKSDENHQIDIHFASLTKFIENKILTFELICTYKASDYMVTLLFDLEENDFMNRKLFIGNDFITIIKSSDGKNIHTYYKKDVKLFFENSNLISISYPNMEFIKGKYIIYINIGSIFDNYVIKNSQFKISRWSPDLF